MQSFLRVDNYYLFDCWNRYMEKHILRFPISSPPLKIASFFPYCRCIDLRSSLRKSFEGFLGCWLFFSLSKSFPLALLLIKTSSPASLTVKTMSVNTFILLTERVAVFMAPFLTNVLLPLFCTVFTQFENFPILQRNNKSSYQNQYDQTKRKYLMITIRIKNKYFYLK